MFCTFNVESRHCSLFAYFQACMIPSHHRAYVFATVVGVRFLRQHGCYRAAYSAYYDMFPHTTARAFSQQAMIFADESLGSSFLCQKKGEIMHKRFVIMKCWADATTFSGRILTAITRKSSHQSPSWKYLHKSSLNFRSKRLAV